MKTMGWSCGALALALVGCAVTDNGTSTLEQEANVNGKKLFEQETFGGNGRTCLTCHAGATGSVSPADAQARFQHNPNDPLFRAIDSDDGVGNSYTKLLTDATIRVTLPLPANWSIQGSSAREITVRRSIPTTLNVPSLDTIFMVDGRNDSLEEQAHGAINSHYQPARQPTNAELAAIADHQQTNKFFSSNPLKHYANGGATPQLPPGKTAAEKRGREWYIDQPQGICSHCHSGPMLNETNEFLAAPFPPGTRFFTAFVSELNKGNAPVYTFLVDNGDGTTTTLESPDPGRALITGDPLDANFFRIPTLWGSWKTGPWFHDHSAKTLPDLAQHYSDYFEIVLGVGLTAQEQSDIIAYLKLLN